MLCWEKLSRSISDVYVKSKRGAERREEERKTFLTALGHTGW